MARFHTRSCVLMSLLAGLLIGLWPAGASAQVIFTVSDTDTNADHPTFSAAVAALPSTLGSPHIIRGLDSDPILEVAGVLITGISTTAINTLEIEGPPGTRSVIDGDNVAIDGIRVTGVGFVTIRNIEVKNIVNGGGSNGIFIGGASPQVRIENCFIHSLGTNNFGIKIESTSSFSVVTGNVIDATGADEGIHLGSTDGKIEHNVIFGHGAYGINIHQATPNNAMIFNNTIYGDGCALGFIDEGGTVVTGADVHDNIFVSTGLSGTGCGIELPSGTGVFSGGRSDYNLFQMTNGAPVSVNTAGVNVTLGDHQTDTSQDLNSQEADPLFLNVAADDFHLQSTAGTFNTATKKHDLFPAGNSPGIDAGDPASPFSFEPNPNGMLINQGAFGNTVEASLSPPPPKLLFAHPIGVSTAGGTTINLHGENLSGVNQVNIGASFPSIDASVTNITVVTNGHIRFSAPALGAGQKFIEVKSGGNTDEIRNAITYSGSTDTVQNSIVGGTTVNAYRLKSLSLFTNAQDTLNQLENCFGPYNTKIWRAFDFHGPTQQYVELPARVNADPGADIAGGGVFLISSTTETCDFTGLSTIPATNFYVPVEPGWGIVSLPSEGSQAWSNVRVGNKGQGSTGANDVEANLPNPFIEPILYAWDGNQYMSASALIGGEAYFVFNMTGDPVVLFMGDPAPKPGDAPEQTLSEVPPGSPMPPIPPGPVASPFSGLSGGGGSGGGDSATQLEGGFTAMGLTALLPLALLAVWPRRRAPAA